MAKRDEKEEGAEVSLEELNNGATQPKHFSTMALLGLSYAILNTWGASSGSIYIGLGSGGPVSVVWGTVVGTLGALAIACSLAEMCQVIPTKGAQYHWCFSLADGRRSQRFLSYMSGWMGTAGWLALTSTAPFLTAQSIQINIQLFHPTFQPGPWFQFVLYMALSVYAALINAFGVRLMNSLNTAALFWSIIGAVTVTVTLLACSGAHGTLRDGRWIFTTFINQTGWPDGVAWIMGLLQTQYSLVGADGAAHIVDEIANPRRNAPLAMVFSCLIGGSSALVVCIAFLAGTTDATAVVEGLGGGYLVAIMQSLGSLVGTTFIDFIYLANQLFTTPALVITCSRMVQSFATDGCLPFAAHLGGVSARFETPLWAVAFNLGWLTVFGLMMFGSPIAITAVQSASVVMLQMSYIPSIALMLLHRRDWFSRLGCAQTPLGQRWGPLVNVIALLYIAVTTVFFLFPAVYPVTMGSEMNYAVVVLVASVLLALANWFLIARTRFTEPRDIADVTGR
ncbi:amino acid transporter [Acaromyces ingoldii]|uniref:Amino acid transporter n=1 Tax=Acaromyces ingoldii TaxID=215250 RepID=A0A316YIV1_9BASI|nr:amino acid transporter [Acaromyces ingoldii]PWN87635.1 amino acid transporter [Acaromyces ingoldii]